MSRAAIAEKEKPGRADTRNERRGCEGQLAEH